MRHDAPRKAHAFRLLHPPPNVGNATHFAAQSHFTKGNRPFRDRLVHQRGVQTQCHRQVPCRFVQLESADHIQVHVQRSEKHAQMFFQYRDQDHHAAIVKPLRLPPRCREAAFGGKHLNFRQNRTGALHHTGNTGAGNAVRSAVQQHCRRVGHFVQSAVLHLEHADLIGRTIPVFHSTQQPVGQVPFSLEIQHGVHNMFHDLRTGNGSVLVDMPHDPHRNIQLFRRVHKQVGALPHLCQAAGTGGNFLHSHGLNGVDNDNIGAAGGNGVADALGIGDCQQKQIFRCHAQTLRPQLDLFGGFLTGNIQHSVFLSEVLADLQQQCAFSDTRLAAQQHNGATHQSAAQHAIQLPHAGGEAYLLILLQRCNGGRLYSIVHTRRFTALGRALRRLLHHGVPRAADGAASRPLGAFAAALRAEKNSFCFHAIPSLVQYWQ